jgi:LysM repeat protein
MIVMQSAWARHDDAPTPGRATYVVQPGDTLTAIAFANGVSLASLLEWNEIADPDVIRVGQRLRIGEASVAATTYVVQAGDTLSALARSAGVSMPQLVEWNQIPDPDVIHVGQLLIVGGVRPSREQYAAGSAPIVTKKPSKNLWPGRPYGDPIAIVLHTAHGSLEGVDSWFLNDVSQHSAHFGVGLDGRVHQYVDVHDRAWANGTIEAGSAWPGPAWLNPNHITISIETEDLGDADRVVTEAQYQATLATARMALKQYPEVRYLVTHRAISPETRASDPGARWIRSGRFAGLAAELGLEPVP